jgi:hypothetical protein
MSPVPLPHALPPSIMRAVRKLYALLPLLALSLSGCSTNSLSVLNPPTKKHAVAAAPTATVPAPSVASNGFDSFAGNCPDAANEDARLIGYATGQNYNFDMQLHVKPTIGCDADPSSAAYKSFIRQATKADLTMVALDTQWVYGYVSTRDLFLQSVFTQMQTHYPSLSDVTITVTYNGQTRATLAFTGHGAPVIQDLYAQ